MTPYSVAKVILTTNCIFSIICFQMVFLLIIKKKWSFCCHLVLVFCDLIWKKCIVWVAKWKFPLPQHRKQVYGVFISAPTKLQYGKQIWKRKWESLLTEKLAWLSSIWTRRMIYRVSHTSYMNGTWSFTNMTVTYNKVICRLMRVNYFCSSSNNLISPYEAQFWILKQHNLGSQTLAWFFLYAFEGYAYGLFIQLFIFKLLLFAGVACLKFSPFFSCLFIMIKDETTFLLSLLSA